MPMTEVCPGAAKAMSYDYDQEQISTFKYLTKFLGANYDPPINGICLGVTMAWLKYRATLEEGESDAFNDFIDQELFNAYLFKDVKYLFENFQKWIDLTGELMAAADFEWINVCSNPFFAETPAELAEELQCPINHGCSFPVTVMYCFLSYFPIERELGHTLGVVIHKNGKVHFFDPNHGYTILPSLKDFTEWLIVTYLKATESDIDMKQLEWRLFPFAFKKG